MKKIIFFVFVLAGCATVPSVHPEKIQNPNCWNIDGLKVIQVLDDGFLMIGCSKIYQGMSPAGYNCDADTVFYKVDTKKKDIVDNQIVSIENGYCMVPDGTYKYTNVWGASKTIRAIKKVNAQIPNQKYIEQTK